MIVHEAWIWGQSRTLQSNGCLTTDAYPSAASMATARPTLRSGKAG